MTNQYLDYLQSEKWKTKREQRLHLSKHKCSACGQSGLLDVHHLTYARIFNEEMSDLLPLCRRHHEIAEQLFTKGLLPRDESVLFLATETIRLILNFRSESNQENKPITHQSFQTRNSIQEELLQSSQFIDILRFGRKAFKRACVRMFINDPRYQSLQSNAYVIYYKQHGQPQRVKHRKKLKIKRPKTKWVFTPGMYEGKTPEPISLPSKAQRIAESKRLQQKYRRAF